MAMTGRQPRKPRPPLNAEKLQNMALRYVERFATSRARLAAYLHRKVRERGWEGAREPDIDGLVARFAELGYVDDRSFALGKARSLGARGYGARRVTQALHQAGIGEEDRADADRHVAEEAVESALRYARRKRLGPFALAELDRAAMDKALAAMVRAGHGFDLSRKIVQLEPGAEVDPLTLGERW
jgi:regulatory protein